MKRYIITTLLWAFSAGQAMAVVKLDIHPYSTTVNKAGQNITATAYRAAVDTLNNQLTWEPVIRRLHGSQDWPRRVGPERLLSPFASRWAYKTSEIDGPNCWHSAVASVAPGWTKERFMGTHEFTCHLEHYFEKVPFVSYRNLKFGDVIRLTYSYGGDLHAATFVGVDRQNPSRAIVLTKNGQKRSPYLFMDLEFVRTKIYPNPRMEVFRLKRLPIDPANTGRSPCATAAIIDGMTGG